MRRFFQAHRDEDFSQIQYLTAKCGRLAHDRAVLEREFLLSRERERKLQNDLEAASAQIFHQEQLNLELRMREDQLISRMHRQQDLVFALQQRVGLLARESSRDEELLRQVGSELMCLQSSEGKLEGLVEELHAEAKHKVAEAVSFQAELHAEAQRRAERTESPQAELRSKTEKLEELQDTNQTLTEKLKDLESAHQTEVRGLTEENQRSLRKLQGTAEQFEWLCQQQRYWMCCVKRFKDCLMEERDALLRQVILLKKKTQKLKQRLRDDSQRVLCPLQDSKCCDCSLTVWDADAVADLESQVEKSNMLYAELFNQAGSPINEHQKPP
ncbi:hyaluronan mediated motility receptor-like isoform X2 [Pseudochaenichthys georgianus]|uniref:hyaluronan mediated motility receptor-like isoform X2 n=1 Tax=Pseudochaenichthys georgianus TaxID=52239 RepID=UPI00146E0850|nr:uncharacterized protein LOC117453533 isoform X2 [Pseudochaenichthys georgianus]